MAMIALSAGLVGFAGKELVAVYRIRVGRRIGSAALIADGLHALTAVAGVLGVRRVRMRWIGYALHADAEQGLMRAIPKLAEAVIHAYAHPAKHRAELAA